MYRVRGMGDCAFNDLACLQAAVGVSSGACASGDTACLAQVASTIAAPPTQPPAQAASPFCGTGSVQWISGVDNCTVLEMAGAALGLMLVIGLLKGGRRR
jgi:hypothetical protein